MPRSVWRWQVVGSASRENSVNHDGRFIGDRYRLLGRLTGAPLGRHGAMTGM
jgi:hypothetical protein